MSTITTQNWDGVAAPSVSISGWTIPSGIVTSATQSQSSPNSLAVTGTGTADRFCIFGSPDASAGDGTVSADVYTNNATAVETCVFGRCSTASPSTSSGTWYEAQLLWSPRDGQWVVQLVSVVNGTTAIIGTSNLINVLSTSAWYTLSLNCSGTTISASLVRKSDGYSLNTSGNFQSASATAAAGTSSVRTASGYWGLIYRSSGAGTSYTDNFSLADTSGGTSIAVSALAGAGTLRPAGPSGAASRAATPLAGAGTLPAASARGAGLAAASANHGAGTLVPPSPRGAAAAPAPSNHGAGALGAATARVGATAPAARLAAAGALGTPSVSTGRSASPGPLRGAGGLGTAYPAIPTVAGVGALAGSWASGRDTFTDAPGTDLRMHAPDSGGSWARHPAYPAGSAAISAAYRLRPSSATAAAWLESAPPAGPDCDVSADFLAVTLPAGVALEAGVVGRSSAAADYFLLRLNWSGGLASWQLCRFSGGTAVAQVSYLPGGIAAGYSATATLRLRGGLASGLIDGVTRLGPLDASALPGAGKAGARLSGMAAYDPASGDVGGIHLDNWSAGGPGGQLGVATAFGSGSLPVAAGPLAGSGRLVSPASAGPGEPYPSGYHHIQTPLVCM